ncbi:MAG: virulence RhuM family protein, partial [Campylobacter sp.]|nr:virulence RhuM family protein [Campylobacter sp.]
YRLRNSTQATRFRIWATETLNEYLEKGFSIDTQRLKNLNQPFDTDYFDELLEKIRDIRLLKEKLEKLQIQKQGLMQNLLIGKVRVK